MDFAAKVGGIFTVVRGLSNVTIDPTNSRMITFFQLDGVTAVCHAEISQITAYRVRIHETGWETPDEKEKSSCKW